MSRRSVSQRRSTMAGVAVFALAAGPAAAQSGDISYVTFDTVDRTFAPAATAQGVVLGLLSYTDPALAQGANVDVLWHEMGADGTFDTWAWTDDDLGMAARWIRGAFSDTTLFAQDTEISIAIYESDPGATPEDPIKFIFGLFETDPLQPALPAASDPGGLVEVLAGIGYAAAPTYSGIAAGGAASGGTGGIGGGYVPAGCLAAFGSEEEVLLQDLYRRATLILAGTDPQTAANDPCAWPCLCLTAYTCTTTPPGTWTYVGSTPIFGGGQVCKWERPATRTWTKTGLKWLWCTNCAATGTGPGGREVVFSTVGPGVACPATPPAGGTILCLR